MKKKFKYIPTDLNIYDIYNINKKQKQTMTNTEITNRLNALNKRQLVSLVWDYTKGGDASRLSKREIVSFLSKKMSIQARDERIKSILD